MQQQINIIVEEFTAIDELTFADRTLLKQAQQATQLAYAPYSNFKVGAAARLNNGSVILGSNQENASYGATICAERVLLSNLAMHYPNQAINTLAISYTRVDNSNTPVSPCGICRQSLLEHEGLYHQPVKIIMAGQTGAVWIVNSVSSLLPLAFSNKDLE
ncbi:MAG: cytidine deaminase [Burkholderiales bacterium]